MVKILRAGLPILVIACLIGCERRQSYESQFHDVVTINFPKGYSEEQGRIIYTKIDELLRQQEVGFASGMLSYSEEVDHIALDLDFQLVDERWLIEKLKMDGLIPKDSEIEFSE